MTGNSSPKDRISIELCHDCRQRMDAAEVEIVRRFVEEPQDLSEAEVCDIFGYSTLEAEEVPVYAVTPGTLLGLLDWIRVSLWTEDPGAERHPAWAAALLVAEKLHRWGVNPEELELLARERRN